jgi:hypothetical protein
MKKVLHLFISLVFTTSLVAQTCDDTLPILEDFEDSNVINVCWNLTDQDGDGNNWYWKEYGPSYGGYKCLSSNEWTSGQGYLDPDNWISSYAIDLTSFQISDNLQLSWKVRGELAGFSHINYSVYAATGNQITDFESSSYKITEYVDEVGGDGNFITRTLDISGLAGNTIYIAFRHLSITGDQYLINIDDVEVTSNSTLGIDDVQLESFSYFYNTSNKILTLKSSANSIQSIQVYNILGKSVLKRNHIQEVEDVNLSSLVNGVYLLKVTFNGFEKTFKFIKH